MNIKRIFLNDSKIINLKPNISNLLLNKDYNIINLLLKKGKKLNSENSIDFNDKGQKITLPFQQTPPPLNKKNLKLKKKKQLLSYIKLKIEKENEKNNIVNSPKKISMYRTKSSIFLKNYNSKNNKKNSFLNPTLVNQTLKITHISCKNINSKINVGTQINGNYIESYLTKTYFKKNYNDKIKCKCPLFKNRTLLYLKKNYDI